MRVETVANYLCSTGVGTGFVRDLYQLQAIYDRIVSGKAWGFLHDTFFYQIDPPVTPVETFTAAVGDTTLVATGAIDDTYLGREFQNDDLPIMVVGIDAAGTTLKLNQPLHTAVLAGSSIEFFRRSYVPATGEGRYLSKVRSDPSYQARSRFGGRTPTRLGLGAEHTFARTRMSGATEFSYRIAQSVRAPVFLPVTGTTNPGGVNPVVGRYRSYTAYKLGPFISELSPVSVELNYAAAVAGDIGTVTATNNSDFEQIFVVEGGLESVEGFSARQSRTGLRVVNPNGTFELDPDWLVQRPLYRPTTGALTVEYSGRPADRKNVAVNGWPRRDVIKSLFDEILLDERFLPLWRDLAKHTETGDGKHLMNARASMSSLVESSAQLL